MKYTVVWLPPAERGMTLLWLNAMDQQAVTNAADTIDLELARDPETKATPVGKFHVREQYPLSVLYHITPDDRMVRVISVRRI
jgi:hypothetical protein